MKGDGEGKMNTVEKQCVVHVCSRPAIVDTSQSVTLPIRISFVTSKALFSLYTFGRLVLGLVPGAGAQSTYKTLYKFTKGQDGWFPDAGVIFEDLPEHFQWLVVQHGCLGCSI